MVTPSFKLTVGEIAAKVGGSLDGAADTMVTGVATLEQAKPGDLVFIGGEKYAALWEFSAASAALISRKIAARVRLRDGASLILVDDADIALATFLDAVAPPAPTAGLPLPDPGGRPAIHVSAFVDPSAVLGVGVRVGACCVVGPRVTVGARTVLYPGAAVFDDSSVGADCVLWSGAIVRERCSVGDRCILHANAVIGGDGFGIRPAPGGQGVVSIRHIGRVEVGNDVEIGACSCVDRGKISATIIGDHCKIDNLCQIGHNTRLGRAVVVAGNVGISGSVTVGDGVMIGGGAGIADHITIGAGASVAAAAGVMRDVAPRTRVGGLPAKELRRLFREVSSIERLPSLMRQLRAPAASPAPAVGPPMLKPFHDWLQELNARSPYKITIRDYGAAGGVEVERDQRETPMTEAEFQLKLGDCIVGLKV